MAIQSAKPQRTRQFNYLVSSGRMTQDELEAAQSEIVKGSIDLETVLLDNYHISKAEMGKALSEHYGCPFIEFDEHTFPDPELLKDLNIDYLKNTHWIPLKRDRSVIDILIDNPQDIEKGMDIKRAFPGVTLRFAVGLRRDIEQFLLATTSERDRGSIKQIIGELVRDEDSEESEDQLLEGLDENHSAIVRLSHQIIAEAFRVGASDIHLEPYNHKKEMVVRLRVDGTCSTYMKIPPSYRRPIVSRFKIMANMDIAERRKPQDGRIRIKLDKDDNSEIELRVAALPTTGNNEDLVMRILTSKVKMPLEHIGCSEDTLLKLRRIAERPHGIILCVGPTGSGKTTTLHAILGHLNTDERKIWTAEDPVEITQEGLRQIQVLPKIGLTFPVAMRAFLRADPDVVMIGEMRDKETADIAIEASLTGHLVLSTLHTNSAVETITRLLDLGCDPFNVADGMLGILAQRLVKTICVKCKEAYHPPKSEYDELVAAYHIEYWKKSGIEYNDSFRLYRGRGCDQCNKTGFRGRVALHELLLGTDEARAMIQSKAKTQELLKLAMDQGMKTLLQDGIDKVLKGLTVFKQVRTIATK